MWRREKKKTLKITTLLDRVVEDGRLVQIGPVRGAQVVVVVKLANVRGNVTHLAASQPKAALERRAVLLLELPATTPHTRGQGGGPLLPPSPSPPQTYHKRVYTSKVFWKYGR